MILCKKDSKTFDIVLHALKNNKIVIIPTDTVYGFSSLVPSGEVALRKLKGRAETKPFIQLLAQPKDIFTYTDTVIPSNLYDLMPAPLTLIVKNRSKKNDDNKQTTAFRCPADLWLRTLIHYCNAPLYSTSVNYAGQPLFENIRDMEAEFGKKIACIVDGGTLSLLPSTIVDLSKGNVDVLRQGSVCI